MSEDLNQLTSLDRGCPPWLAPKWSGPLLLTRHNNLSCNFSSYEIPQIERACMQSFTCRCVLQQLFELCRWELCASYGHDHTKLCELHLDVVLLQKTEQCCGGDPLGGAVRRALHQVNGHVCPERERGNTWPWQKAKTKFLLFKLLLRTYVHSSSRKTCYRPLLIIGQGFNTIYVDGEGLVASEDLVEGLHQLLLLSSHISFLFVDNYDH